MPRTVLVSLLVIGSLLVGSVAGAQTDFKPRPGGPAPPPETHPPGRSASGRERVTTRIAIGEQAPNFELTQPDGRSLRLSSLRGNWVMLFFIERRDSLAALEPVGLKLDKLGVRTLAMCYDKPQALRRVLAGRELHFVPLADPTGDIIALYGLLDSATGVVHPGFVLVNPRGNVRLALLGQALPLEEASRLVQFAVTEE